MNSGIRTVPALLLLASLSTNAREGTHEEYPVLNASELLKPEIRKGPYHEVMEAVPTEGFANQYTVKTKWGVYTVRGNDLLVKRIHEYEAIERLEHASKSEEFERSLRAAAAKPLHMIGGTLQDPKGTMESIGSGASKFFRRAGEAFDRKGAKSANTDSAMASMFGFSKAKRGIAAHLQVDPYTDNQLLQQRLEEVAKASFAGGFAVSAGTFALSAGAGVGAAGVAGAASMSSDVANMIRDNSPLDLSDMNRDVLLALGVNEPLAAAFVEHPGITPTGQTVITQHLKRLGKVAGMDDFLKMVMESKDSTDVLFFQRTAEMMVTYHETVSPVKRILNLYTLPAIHAQNNALVLPLAIDYGSWSAEADRLSRTVAGYQPEVEISQRLLYISGRITPRAREELQKRGFAVTDEALVRIYQ